MRGRAPRGTIVDVDARDAGRGSASIGGRAVPVVSRLGGPLACGDRARVVGAIGDALVLEVGVRLPLGRPRDRFRIAPVGLRPDGTVLTG